MMVEREITTSRRKIYDPRLRVNLGTILEQWEQNMDRCSCEIDNVYLPGEMTQVAFFSQAVAKADGVAYVEYPDCKIVDGEVKQNCRIDLWFRIGSEDYISEAKSRTVSIEHVPEDVFGVLAEGIGSACQDTNNSYSYYKSEDPTAKPLAPLFASFSFKASSKDQYEDFLKDWEIQVNRLEPSFYSMSYITPGKLDKDEEWSHYPPCLTVMGKLLDV